jgi:uncharacterized membrane protein YphA (DoxX/SURF4 family)
MDSSTRFGRLLFALGLAGFGLQILLRAELVKALQPVSWDIPARGVLVWFCGMVLFLGGACIALERKARPAALTLGVVLPLWILLFHLPALIQKPGSGNGWTGLFETLALAGAAWVLAGGLSSAQPVRGEAERRIDRAAALGRLAFAASLPVFGVLHFIYADYVASVIPAWIPWHPFWAYCTGACHIAAGLAILTRIQARLAARLLGIMFGSWVLLLHIPRVFDHDGDHREWASLLMAIALCGGAWLVAGSLQDGARRTA